VTYVPFKAADDIGDRFLALLRQYNIHPPTGSSFEDELLSLTQLIEVAKRPNLAQGIDQVAVLRAAAGVHDFAAKVLSVESVAEFQTFIPHLSLIAETKIPRASLVQNAQSAYNDDTARKMAELYIGCLAAHVGIQVALDSPTNAKGDNSDVIFAVEKNEPSAKPESWALALKTISSKRGQTIFERIEEGAHQIDDIKCIADKGIVIINAKNALDHDALWNTTFSSVGAATDALAAQLDDLADKANADRDQSEWDALFFGKAARPVLFLDQSLVRVPTPVSQQTPTPLKILRAYGANGTVDPAAYSLAHCLNHFMQAILLGLPGTSGQWPR
jgi:hypothetical protein